MIRNNNKDTYIRYDMFKCDCARVGKVGSVRCRCRSVFVCTNMKVFPYLSSCPTSSIGTGKRKNTDREGGGGEERDRRRENKGE